MTSRFSAAASIAAALLLGACLSSRPVVDPASGPPTQEGTIAGHVRTDTNAPLPGRLVRAVRVDGSSDAYQTTTSETGSYTMKIRPGRYRLVLELRPGERLVKEPGETNVNPSDLDPARDFVVAAR